MLMSWTKQGRVKTKTKGLEQIVAAVLLIAVAAIGAALVHQWFAGYAAKATSQAVPATERLSIEAANLSSTGTAYLYVRNLGGYNVALATAYLLQPGAVSPLCATSAIAVYGGLDTTTGAASTLYPGQVQLVRISFGGCGIASGSPYVIKIATRQGTQLAVAVTAS
jgi:hypothetical protein